MNGERRARAAGEPLLRGRRERICNYVNVPFLFAFDFSLLSPTREDMEQTLTIVILILF